MATFSVEILAKRFKDVENEYQHDLVIRHMGEFFEKKALKDPGILISKGDIQKLYDNLIGLNPSSSFRKLFGDLIEELPTKNSSPQPERSSLTEQREVGDDTIRTLVARVAEMIPTMTEVVEKPRQFTDNDIVMAIGKVQAGFDDAVIENASKVVVSELKRVGIENLKVRIAEVQKGKILVEAQFVTKFGNAQIMVPVEVKEGVALYPVKFYSGEKEYELSRQAMEQCLNSLLPEDMTSQYDKTLVEATYNDIRKVMHTAIFNKNFSRAKEALLAVKDKWPQNFNAMFEDYQHWVKQAASNVEARCKGCSYYVVKGTSVYPTCARYNVAAFKIVKGTNGCAIASVDFDKVRDEAYTGVLNTSQILFPVK